MIADLGLGIADLGRHRGIGKRFRIVFIRKLVHVILSPSTGSGQASRRISVDPLTMRFFVALLLRMTFKKNGLWIEVSVLDGESSVRNDTSCSPDGHQQNG